MIQKGQRIRIKENLRDVLTELLFEQHTVERMSELFTGTEQVAHCIWKDGDQEYVTIELCCEIPIQCCEAICYPKHCTDTSHGECWCSPTHEENLIIHNQVV
jgi:hypothetical protein